MMIDVLLPGARGEARAPAVGVAVDLHLSPFSDALVDRACRGKGIVKRLARRVVTQVALHALVNERDRLPSHRRGGKPRVHCAIVDHTVTHDLRHEPTATYAGRGERCEHGAWCAVEVERWERHEAAKLGQLALGGGQRLRQRNRPALPTN